MREMAYPWDTSVVQRVALVENGFFFVEEAEFIVVYVCPFFYEQQFSLVLFALRASS
jgi:hypothetical protein